MNRMYRWIALMLFWLSATMAAGPAHAQEIRDEIASIERELPATLSDPVRMAALRSLVATLLEYRISVNLLGYEQSGDFGPVWNNFNALMYDKGPLEVLAKLQAGAATKQEFADTVSKAYADNAALYDEFLNRMLRDVFGISDGAELKQRFLRAMLTYAIMNWIHEPSLDAEWHSKSWTFPFCPRRN